jgi:hypothetical protein
MKINLNIFDSILFGDLRPWLSENFHHERFKSKATPVFCFKGTNAIDCLSSIFTVLKNMDITIPESNSIYEVNDSDIDLIQADDLIKGPLIELEYRSFTNPKTEFYYHLIKSFSSCLISNLHLIVNHSDAKSVDKYIINSVYDKIKSLFPEINNRLHSHGYEDDMPFEISDSSIGVDVRKDTDFILKTLRTNLIRMICEIQELFKENLISPILSDTDICTRLAGITAADIPIKKDITKLNEFLVERFISKKSYSLEEAKTRIIYTLEYYNRHKEIPDSIKIVNERKEMLTHHIKALQNLIYLREFKNYSVNPSYAELISDSFSLPIYEDETRTIHNQLEECSGYVEKLELINKKREQLDMFRNITLQGNDIESYSIPYKVLNWLDLNFKHISESKHIINNNTPPTSYKKIPTDLSVDKLAYLFRALCDGKVMMPKVEADMHKAIVALFSSERKEDLSLKSVSNKFISPELAAVEYWVSAFTELQRIADKKYKELTR